ncbi:hypothetical protein ACR2Y3_001581 [Salmonella enterica subsp. enterica serovar Cubana]
MKIIRFSYPDLLKASKNLSYREQVTKISVVLMTFLKQNNLILIEPFDVDGNLKKDIELYNYDLSDFGNALFKEYYPKWSAYIDRGGDVNNIKILNDGLNILRNR